MASTANIAARNRYTLNEAHGESQAFYLRPTRPGFQGENPSGRNAVVMYHEQDVRLNHAADMRWVAEPLIYGL